MTPTAPRSASADFPWKPLSVLVVAAAAILLVNLTQARRYIANVHDLQRWLESLGWIGPAAWMAIVFALVAVGVPRLLFCPISGLAFGFWQGLLWTQVATLAGYYVVFVFVRWGGRDFVLRRWPRLGRLQGHLDGRSATLFVFAARLLPITGLIVNPLLALSPVRHRQYLLGTALGNLPEAIPLTLVTSGSFMLTGHDLPLYVGGAAALLLAVCVSTWYVSRRSALLADVMGGPEMAGTIARGGLTPPSDFPGARGGLTPPSDFPGPRSASSG